MTHNKNIGRVISVDNFRVSIKLDADLHSAFKSGVQDIYEIARINSYIIIPVGADRIVCLITRVKMQEETEFDKHTTAIKLPTSARYVTATMLGTIAKNDKGKDIFIQGIYNFPSLDNPVWYVTEEDLKHIFDSKDDSDSEEKDEVDYAKDFYLSIGESPAFPGYKVKICPDQFFAKHAAILGNTGSGKSCTVASIIRNLFKHDYGDNKQKLENAHFVIFDTNGEYKSAFLNNDFEDLKQINAYYYGEDGTDKTVKVPYWFMNWGEFKDLLNPGEGAQAPVLTRAIGLAKNQAESIEADMLPAKFKRDIDDILSLTTDKLKYRTAKDFKYLPNNQVINLGEAIKELGNKNNEELGNLFIFLGSADCFDNAKAQQPVLDKITNLYDKLKQESAEKQITNEENIDLPTWFSYKDLCEKFIDVAIKQEEGSNKRIREFTSTLRLRMNSFFNDKRIAIPLMLANKNDGNKEILAQFIAFILGDFNKCFATESNGSFIQKYNERNKYNNKNGDKKRTNQITIIDTSLLPFEVLDIVTALIGRLIIDFVSHFMPNERGQHPIVLILEEAQNYIAERKESVSKNVFERIAREGRKYGVSLVVCSQRPSELSKTVLSQCNSYVIHRLQNPEDQQYIKSLVSSASADILNQLPVIPRQHAIITGDCVRTPVQVRIDKVDPTPNSNDPEYIKCWLNKESKIPYKETCQKWLGKEDKPKPGAEPASTQKNQSSESSTEDSNAEDDDVSF